jgi:hypothetical protein
LLSATVFFSCLAGGQAALIQGMRRISDLVRMGVLGAALGTMIGLPIVYCLREDGIVPSLICGAAISLIASWWYSRKLRIQTPLMTVAQIGHEAAGLLKLGFVFMASSLMMTGASYAMRVVHFPRPDAISDRPPAQWIPAVGHEHQNWCIIHFNFSIDFFEFLRVNLSINHGRRHLCAIG